MPPLVFVSGTWRASKALPYAAEALELGEALAKDGLDLACGPGTGIARPVIDGYRSVPQRGKVIYFLPKPELMAAVGEVVAEGADQIIQTEFDYAMRNTWQMAKCHGLFILTGGDGALEEALPALIDYDLPVAVVENSGPAAVALKLLVDVFPRWKNQLMFGGGVAELIPEFIKRAHERAIMTAPFDA